MFSFMDRFFHVDKKNIFIIVNIKNAFIFAYLNKTTKYMETTITTPEIESQKLQSADYYINYHGKMIDIQNNDKILCLCVGGGGFGDGGPDRTWWSKYDLYITSDFGKTLKKIGEAGESGNGYEVSSNFTINGMTHHFDGLSAEQFFHKIFKR